jgi:hypothetical protein
MKDDEMHGRREKCVRNFGRKARREDPAIDRSIILKYISEKQTRRKSSTGFIWHSIVSSDEVL